MSHSFARFVLVFTTIFFGAFFLWPVMQILKGGFIIVLAVFTLHSGGFLMGYLLARLLRIDIIQARTISIEVGMQNSGLGVVVATKYLGAWAAVSGPA